MTIVIDAALTIAWYFQDGGTPATDALLELVAESGAVVPVFWRLDVANAFQAAVRQKRIDLSYREASLNELLMMPITIDTDTSNYAWTTTLRIAERFSLTLYEAAYLELAQRRSLPLASLSQEMRAAAPALNIEVLDPAS